MTIEASLPIAMKHGLKKGAFIYDYSNFQKEAIERLKSGQSLTGKDGILTPLLQDIINASLEGELEHHLDDCEASGGVNRKRQAEKKVQSASGAFEIETPRDRAGSFEPELVKKRQTILNDGVDLSEIDLYQSRDCSLNCVTSSQFDHQSSLEEDIKLRNHKSPISHRMIPFFPDGLASTVNKFNKCIF